MSKSLLTCYQSHQNKFHSDILRNLTLRFASMCEGDTVSAMDKDLWEYFSILYKNSNKGIKGRGKDRRISAISKDDEDVKGEMASRSSSSDASSGNLADVFDRHRDKDEMSSSSSSVGNDEHDLEYSIEDDLLKNCIDGTSPQYDTMKTSVTI